MINRRDLIRFLGGTASISLAGCWRGAAFISVQDPTISLSSSASEYPSACIVRPQQSEGPFFMEERLNRSDIRSDPTSGIVKAGIPLQLNFQVFQLRDRLCLPLDQAVVDLWHCDAEGLYSSADPFTENTDGQQFLRGYQVTDSDGHAQFTTIFPGTYPGRAVHIHFKIRTNLSRGETNQVFDPGEPIYEFTSQLYFDDALTETILTSPAYAHREQWTPNLRDRLFQQGGTDLLLALNESSEGFVGNFSIALNLG